MNAVVPAAAQSTVRERVVLRVSSEMVSAFAALTGDRSSLHVAEEFARRSAYRRSVVHGMLPVAFLALQRPFNVEGYRATFRSLTGRFASPVFAGDELELTTSFERVTDDGEAAFAFRIERRGGGPVVTEGTTAVAYSPASTASADAGSPTMLADPPQLADRQLEDISVGQTAGFDFRVDPAAIEAFAAILRSGAVDAAVDPAQTTGRVDLTSLLAVLVFSTSVGVTLPGKPATFLEFTAKATDSLRVGAPYRLEASVAHRSRSTRIIKNRIQVTRADVPGQAVISGTVAVMVAKPPKDMPGMEELAAAAPWRLDGKVALVTGASRGIGETTAKLLAHLGARVIVNYHRGAADAGRVVREISAGGGEAVAIAGDVSNPDDVARLVEEAVARFGGVDILVNNAARDYRPVPFLDLRWEEVDADLAVILRGALLCCQRVIPHMLARGGGRIVNVVSVATDNPPPDQTKYVVAKSALVGLTRSLSIEFASRNILVNMVSPSFVETDFVAHVQEGFRSRIAQDTPMRRLASPIDVARAIAFLASPLASFTTGQKIMVTGGGAPYA